MTSFEVHNGEVSIVGETKGTGPQVVCINGWANSRDVWSDLSENLCKDHQVTIWDLRGHGESGAPPGNYGREEALKDISAVLDQVGRPCVLVGHSLGGYLSLAYALENPDELLSCSCCGTRFEKLKHAKNGMNLSDKLLKTSILLKVQKNCQCMLTLCD